MNRWPIKGVEVWKNEKNQFFVFQAHYSANPAKDTPEYKNTMKSAMPIRQYMQEFELQWESYEGTPVYPDFSRQLHGSKDPIDPVYGLPLLRGWDFGLCYDDETEVLTEAGWKLFKDVDIKKDRVATLDPATFELNYEFPKLKVDQEYHGDMIVWDNENIQARITENHIVPVWNEESKDLRRYFAKDLLGQGHNLIRLTANWNGSDLKNPLDLSPKLFGAFMGAYLSEGSSDKKKIQIYQKESNKGWLREVVSATEWDWREGQDVLRLYDPEKASYLAGFGVSGEKFVPEEIRFGSKETILEFLRTYTLGDGHIRVRPNGSEEHTIYSKSKRMIDDLSELALKVGWLSSVTEIGETTSYYAAEDRWITTQGGWNIRFKKGYDWSHLRSAKKALERYDGRVYCLSVQSGILYVRKNGRPHWNGNTPACVVGQYVDGQLRILREFVAYNKGAEQFSTEVLRQMAVLYPGWADPKRDWRDAIDPAGEQRKDTDMSTCAKVLISKGLTPFPGPVAWEPRRRAVEQFLVTISNKQPAFLIDMANCPVLVRGFEGGYRYPEKSLEIEPHKIRPLKDEHSHPHDALQYLCAKLKDWTRIKQSTVPSPEYFAGRSHKTLGMNYGVSKG